MAGYVVGRGAWWVRFAMSVILGLLFGLGWPSAALPAPAAVPASPSQLVSVSPKRVLDTRSGLGAPKAAVSPGRALTLQVAGRGGVPSTGASAVVLNVTMTQAIR